MELDKTDGKETMLDIWIWVQQRDGRIEAPTFGLAAEARRLIAELNSQLNSQLSSQLSRVTALSFGPTPDSELSALGAYGVDRVLSLSKDAHYQGEYVTRILHDAIEAEKPSCLLAAGTAQTNDLFPRLAACLDTGLVTRAMDFHMAPDGTASAVRPIANGYLFEQVALKWHMPPLVSFLPGVLPDIEPGPDKNAPVTQQFSKVDRESLKTRVVRVTAASAEKIDLEEADLIVAGGRGAGKADAFEVVQKLARALGAAVGATRPVIDLGILPYKRQIGQTGKYVSPRLIINCGISGANEYTAGMEKAHKVIAIDQNPRARIFKFADLGIVGDIHDILPRLTARIKELKAPMKQELKND